MSGRSCSAGRTLFFEAETFFVNEAPDLHVIDLYIELGCQLGRKSSKGEVALCSLKKPLTQLTREQSRLVPANLVRSDTPFGPVPLKPFDRATRRHSKANRCCSSRHSIALDRRNHPFSQVHRYGSDHAMLASKPSNQLESDFETKGNPLRFNQTSSSSRAAVSVTALQGLAIEAREYPIPLQTSSHRGSIRLP